MNGIPRTMREPIMQRWGTIGYSMKLQTLLLRRELIMINKTKWELLALVSSRSLDERTAVESQINGLYLTSWCRHHNTLISSKSCNRGTQCHPDAFWRYRYLFAYSCSLKIAPRLTFRWWIGEKDPERQICMQKPHSQVPSIDRHARISLALIWYHTCRAKGMYQIWTLFRRVSVQDPNSVFGVRTCWCISCKPLCCNPHESSNPAKAASIGSVFVWLGYEGWNPCTCYLPCTSKTRCTHRWHNMWLCYTAKGSQHTI